jgi:hypothetical protein
MHVASVQQFPSKTSGEVKGQVSKGANLERMESGGV